MRWKEYLHTFPPYRAAARWKRRAVQRRRNRIAGGILQLPPRTVPRPAPGVASLHLLTCERDWLGSLWTVRTFLQQTGRDFPVAFHDDGTLSAPAASALRAALPGAVVWSLADATARVEPRLRNFPQCRRARTRHPMLLKLLDPALLAEGERYLLLDSDLLFFAPPEEILGWLDHAERVNLWNADPQDHYNITAAQAREWYGINLIGRINCGFGAVCRESVDLQLAEDFLGRESSWAVPHRTEQTAHAVLSSRFGARLLPPSYLISADRMSGLPQGIVMKHYVGVVRDLFFSEGIRRLTEDGFLASAKAKRG